MPVFLFVPRLNRGMAVTTFREADGVFPVSSGNRK